MPELAIGHVEHDSVIDLRPISVARKKTNSASGSMKFWMSHGQATRSTLIFSRVIHFIISERKVEPSADAVRERSFINGSRGHGVFNSHAGAVENYDFIVGDATDFLARDDFA